MSAKWQDLSSKTASFTLIIIGFLVLAGWDFNIQFFKSLLPNLATMSANSQLGFVFIGAALWILSGEQSEPRKRYLLCYISLFYSC